MGAFKDFIADGITELIDTLDTPTFSWKGGDVPYIRSNLRKGLTVEIGGQAYEVTCDIIVLKSNFLSADSTLITVDSDLYTVDNGKPHPVAGRKLTIEGHSCKIISATVDPSQAYYQLTLGDAQSGR